MCRLQEQSDLNAAKDLFGGGPEIDLETFAPKSVKDFEELARAVVAKYIQPHEKSAHFKALLKALLKCLLATSDVQTVKDLESCLAGIRSDKLKEEKAAAAAKKGKLSSLAETSPAPLTGHTDTRMFPENTLFGRCHC